MFSRVVTAGLFSVVLLGCLAVYCNYILFNQFFFMQNYMNLVNYHILAVMLWYITIRGIMILILCAICLA